MHNKKTLAAKSALALPQKAASTGVALGTWAPCHKQFDEVNHYIKELKQGVEKASATDHTARMRISFAQWHARQENAQQQVEENEEHSLIE